MSAIKIIINNRRKVFAVKHLFSTFFPELKLEFFRKPHTSGGPHSDKTVGEDSATLADCRSVSKTGTITISPEMTVTELESCFRDIYGLKVEVFRKSPEGWVRAASPDVLSLREQTSDLIF